MCYQLGEISMLRREISLRGMCSILIGLKQSLKRKHFKVASYEMPVSFAMLAVEEPHPSHLSSINKKIIVNYKNIYSQ